jgi:hypothetical protein
MALKLCIFALGFFAGLFFWLYLISEVRAHHNVYLPLVPDTWLMQNLITDGEQTWCVNSAAANYPGFVAQLRDVNDAYAERVGIRQRQVAGVFSDPRDAIAAGCEVWHQGRYDAFCSGCAANVYYANRPVTVNYKLSLGFFDFRSTQGHEMGHALLGLHEQYVDLGSIGCTGRQDTVMDCGSGVRYPTQLDVDRGCQVLDPGKRIFAGSMGCAPPDPWGPCASWGGCYHQDIQCWVARDGWLWTAATGWMAHQKLTSWGGYYNATCRAWIASDGAIFAGGSWEPLPPWLRN